MLMLEPHFLLLRVKADQKNRSEVNSYQKQCGNDSAAFSSLNIKIMTFQKGLCLFTLHYSPFCPTVPSDKLKEDDYDDIPDDLSVPVSMEVDQVMLTSAGEAGKNSAEVNTASVQTIGTQDESQTADFL